MFQLLSPTDWTHYELIDCGNFEKLERFGQYTLIRPEPQAVWNKALSEEEWQRKSDARYIREKGKDNLVLNADKGRWQTKPGMPESWYMDYGYKEMKLRFRLALTSFGHIGIFPEQAENWKYIYDTLLHDIKVLRPKVLNLFAYTGGASLAARAAGADVTHLDSVKQTITWTNSNREASGLEEIRWMVEDAMKFIKREARRGNRYHGIIMDPPAYGRGPTGEKWVLEQGINELIEVSSQILEPTHSFCIINLYSMGLSALVIDNLVQQHFHGPSSEMGELYLQSSQSQKLPLGTFLRFKR
jgi:23S rRNA (cytosine1962-C5)-methyltransferase